MNVFVDTSALVKYFHEEKGTAAVAEIIDNPENNIFVSDLSKLEFISALHRRYRRKEIGKKSLQEAIEAFGVVNRKNRPLVAWLQENRRPGCLCLNRPLG